MSAQCPAPSHGFSGNSGEAEAADAVARHSPSGLGAGFMGHPCPITAGCCTEWKENLRLLRRTPHGHYALTAAEDTDGMEMEVSFGMALEETGEDVAVI